MKNCIICGEKTARPFAAAVWHFRPIDWEQRKWVKGTFKTFGLNTTLTLMLPFFNTLLYWKYRKMRLSIEEVSE